MSSTKKSLDLFPSSILSYTLKEYLHGGIHSDVCLYAKNDDDEKVVVKFENTKISVQTLTNQALMLRKMTSTEISTEGIPRYIDHGLKEITELNVTYNYLMMEYVDQSAQEVIHEKVGGALSFGQICIEMLNALKIFHQRGFIHRDIQPDTFRFKGKKAYLIDFRLVREYMQNGEHLLKWDVGKIGRGTPQFTSLNTHWKYEASRRDDLISLGYTILFLSHGSLPWSEFDQKLNSSQQQLSYKETIENIIKSKEALSEDSFSQLRDQKIVQLIAYLNQSLKNEEDFYSEPDYDYILEKLEDLDEKVIDDQTTKVQQSNQVSVFNICLGQEHKQDQDNSSAKTIPHLVQRQSSLFFDSHNIQSSNQDSQEFTFQNVAQFEIFLESDGDQSEELSDFLNFNLSLQFQYDLKEVTLDFNEVDEEEEKQELMKIYCQFRYKSYLKVIEKALELNEQVTLNEEKLGNGFQQNFINRVKEFSQKKKLKIVDFKAEQEQGQITIVNFQIQTFSQLQEYIAQLKCILPRIKPIRQASVTKVQAATYIDLERAFNSLQFINNILQEILEKDQIGLINPSFKAQQQQKVKQQPSQQTKKIQYSFKFDEDKIEDVIFSVSVVILDDNDKPFKQAKLIKREDKLWSITLAFGQELKGKRYFFQVLLGTSESLLFGTGPPLFYTNQLYLDFDSIQQDYLRL